MRLNAVCGEFQFGPVLKATKVRAKVLELGQAREIVGIGEHSFAYNFP